MKKLLYYCKGAITVIALILCWEQAALCRIHGFGQRPRNRSKKSQSNKEIFETNQRDRYEEFFGIAAQFKEACLDLMGVIKSLSDTTSFKVTPGFNEKGQKIKNHKRAIVWNQPLEVAFIKAKKLLTDADGRVLTPFDPTLLLTYMHKQVVEWGGDNFPQGKFSRNF